jgi:hypothetical protein
VIDGCYQKDTTIEFSMNHVVMKKPPPETHLFVGHAVQGETSSSAWQLGNLMLFKGNVSLWEALSFPHHPFFVTDNKLSKHASFHIYALGPDSLSLVQADCSDIQAEYSHLVTEDIIQNGGLSPDIFTGSHAIYMQHLRVCNETHLLSSCLHF